MSWFYFTRRESRRKTRKRHGRPPADNARRAEAIMEYELGWRERVTKRRRR